MLTGLPAHGKKARLYDFEGVFGRTPFSLKPYRILSGKRFEDETPACARSPFFRADA